jgi:hypothetical protein
LRCSLLHRNGDVGEQMGQIDGVAHDRTPGL